MQTNRSDSLSDQLVNKAGKVADLKYSMSSLSSGSFCEVWASASTNVRQ